LPFYAILVLPILFAAGMCLMDTTDGVFMNYAYGWAFAKPVRKIFYNLAITSISVADRPVGGEGRATCGYGFGIRIAWPEAILSLIAANP
jgi:hypothetical protein